MVKVVSVEEMRAIEAAADAAGVSYAQMMQNAGQALATRVLALLAGRADARIAVLVGSGNNGGDALLAAQHIAANSSAVVSIYLYKPREADDPVFAPVQEAGLFVAQAGDDRQYRVLKNLVASSDVVIDGLLGIGFTPPIQGELQKVLRAVHEALDVAHREAPRPLYEAPAIPDAPGRSGPYIVAVDCASGLDCNSGDLDAVALPADETVTFIAAKQGQLRFPGAGANGTLYVADIGLPERLPARDDIALELLTGADVQALLPALPADAHKGTFGKTMIVAGSLNYTGAAALAAGAAYRAGAGLVTVGAPGPVVAALATQISEATWLLLPHDLGVIAEGAAKVLREEIEGYSALLLGPGWGREETTGDFLSALLAGETQQAMPEHHIGFANVPQVAAPPSEAQAVPLPPLVVDADGLNLLSQMDDWWTWLPANTILTPHPGEMARLCAMERDAVNADRVGLARQKAAEWHCVLVLKGAYTVIAAPEGPVIILPFAEPALATAGTGDVLAGTIAGLLGQGLAPRNAALVGGYLHGLAGHLAAQQLGSARSVRAGDVLNALPAAMHAVETAV